MYVSPYKCVGFGFLSFSHVFALFIVDYEHETPNNEETKVSGLRVVVGGGVVGWDGGTAVVEDFYVRISRVFIAWFGFVDGDV